MKWIEDLEYWWEYGAYGVKDTQAGTELELIVTGTLPPMSLNDAKDVISPSCSLFPDVTYIVLTKCADMGTDTVVVAAYSKWRGNPWKEMSKKFIESRFKAC